MRLKFNVPRVVTSDRATLEMLDATNRREHQREVGSRASRAIREDAATHGTDSAADSPDGVTAPGRNKVGKSTSTVVRRFVRLSEGRETSGVHVVRAYASIRNVLELVVGAVQPGPVGERVGATDCPQPCKVARSHEHVAHIAGKFAVVVENAAVEQPCPAIARVLQVRAGVLLGALARLGLVCHTPRHRCAVRVSRGRSYVAYLIRVEATTLGT